MEIQAYIEIKKDGGGEFQFGLVRGYFSEGWLDEDGEGYEFEWEGGDEMDEASGSCLLTLTDKDHIEGEFTFDNSDFAFVKKWLSFGTGGLELTMAKSVQLSNGREWKTQKGAEEHFRAIRDRHPLRTPIDDAQDHDDLLALLVRYDAAHSEEESKIGCGVDYFDVRIR